jgi:hypothetical protein
LLEKHCGQGNYRKTEFRQTFPDAQHRQNSPYPDTQDFHVNIPVILIEGTVVELQSIISMLQSKNIPVVDGYHIIPGAQHIPYEVDSQTDDTWGVEFPEKIPSYLIDDRLFCQFYQFDEKGHPNMRLLTRLRKGEGYCFWVELGTWTGEMLVEAHVIPPAKVPYGP